MSDKNAYEQKLEAKLDEWSAEIDRLVARSKQADADAQIELERELDDARSKRDAARKKLGELKNAGDDAWEDLKNGIEGAWSSLETSLKAARSRF